MIKVIGLLSALLFVSAPASHKLPQAIKISTRARPSVSLLASPLAADLTFMRGPSLAICRSICPAILQ